jgi:hypothetical protein
MRPTRDDRRASGAQPEPFGPARGAKAAIGGGDSADVCDGTTIQQGAFAQPAWAGKDGRQRLASRALAFTVPSSNAPSN